MRDFARSSAAILSLLCCFCALSGNAQTTSLIQVRAEAEQALSAGDVARSAALSQSVLIQYPSDYQALYLLSLAQAQLGQHGAAAISAKRAFQAGKKGNDKLQAARIAAAANFQLGRYTRAEWWLRRASNHTQNAQDDLAVSQEFQVIRRKNPLSISLGFSIAPSNNINGGTEDTTFSLGDFRFLFNPGSRALSGVEYSGDAQFTYRLSRGSNHITEAGLYLYGRTYSLSSSAKSIAPNLSGSDFALGLVELSLSHRRNLFAGLGPTGVSFHQGQVWYGGSPVWRYSKLGLSQGIVLGPNTSASLQASMEDQTGLRPTQADARVYFVQGRLAHRIANQDVVRVSLSRRFNQSDLQTNTYTDYRATLGYEFAKAIWGTKLSLSASIGRKKYDEFSLSLNGRRDRYASVGATAVFQQIEYLGFSPSWSLLATETKSNVSRFTTQEVTGRVGLQSNF